MKYLVSILALCLGSELKAQEVVLYPDSFYRYEFSSKEEFEKSARKREIKSPTEWEYDMIYFSASLEDSLITFNKGLKEFPQQIEEAWYYKSPFRRKRKAHYYFFVRNSCDVTAIFVDVPGKKNQRTLIYYHQKLDLKYEAVYFPYDSEKMQSVVQRMQYGEE